MIILLDRVGSLTGMLSHGLLLFLTAVVSSVTLARLISNKITVVTIASLKFINPLLKLPKVQFQVLVHLSHLQILLLEVLSALVGLLKLLV